MDIEGLHGLGETDQQKAQALMNNIVQSDSATRNRINTLLVQMDKLKAKGVPASFFETEKEKLSRITMNVANRNEKIKAYADGKGLTVTLANAPATISNYTKSIYTSAASAVKSGSDQVKKAWQWLFSSDTKGLGAVQFLVVGAVLVASAAAGAVIYKQFFGDWGKATQDAKELTQVQDLCKKAIAAGLIKNCDAINKEINDALQKEHEAGAKGQWWQDIGSLAKIGIPVLAGGWLVIVGIPKLMAYSNKRKG